MLCDFLCCHVSLLLVTVISKPTQNSSCAKQIKNDSSNESGWPQRQQEIDIWCFHVFASREIQHPRSSSAICSQQLLLFAKLGRSTSAVLKEILVAYEFAYSLEKDGKCRSSCD